MPLITFYKDGIKFKRELTVKPNYTIRVHLISEVAFFLIIKFDKPILNKIDLLFSKLKSVVVALFR